MRTGKGCVVCCAALLLALTTGCRGPAPVQSAPSAEESRSSSSAASTVSSEQSAPDAAKVLEKGVEWETKRYEDAYLAYEIPASWEESPEYSSAEDNFTFFIPSESQTEYPSNVNIQITNLDNASKGMDYGDATVQRDFHEFIVTQGGLPAQAKDREFAVYRTGDTYIYAYSFSRAVDDGGTVKQTAVFPVGFDYGVVIWATDWNDGASPAPVEVALHLCSTLEKIES